MEHNGDNNQGQMDFGDMVPRETELATSPYR